MTRPGHVSVERGKDTVTLHLRSGVDTASATIPARRVPALISALAFALLPPGAPEHDPEIIDELLDGEVESDAAALHAALMPSASANW